MQLLLITTSTIFLYNLTMCTSAIILDSARGSFVDGRPLVLYPLFAKLWLGLRKDFFEVNGTPLSPRRVDQSAPGAFSLYRISRFGSELSGSSSKYYKKPGSIQ